MAFNFKDIIPKNPNSTLIVDALNLAFRWKHSGRTDFRYEFKKTVESLAQSYESKKIIIAADWGSSSYRKTIFPEYKADRKERFKDQSEEEKIAFEDFFEEYEAALKVMEEDYTVLRFQNVEADDIAAHLVKHKEQYELENIWLISSDRDWNLLVQEGVSQFSTVTRKEYTDKNWHEHYNFPKEKYVFYKALLGDKGDNIPGFKQIGPKRVEGFIKTYDTVFDLYNDLPIESKYKYMEDLNANPDRLLLNVELMDLLEYCDEAIGEENIQEIRLVMGDVPW